MDCNGKYKEAKYFLGEEINIIFREWDLNKKNDSDPYLLEVIVNYKDKGKEFIFSKVLGSTGGVVADSDKCSEGLLRKLISCEKLAEEYSKLPEKVRLMLESDFKGTISEDLAKEWGYEGQDFTYSEFMQDCNDDGPDIVK